MRITVETHLRDVLEAKDEAVKRALEMCGLKAEGYAKKLCPVDTGLLRNSITHAVSGESAAISSYHAAKGSNRNSKGKRISASSVNAGAVGFGRYSGTVGSSNDKKVYIGTNVEYAPYVEEGTSRTDPKPFLRPALADHADMYKRIIESELRNG